MRDVLLRLESLGILEKDERQRWVVIPLDAQRIHDLYELRSLVKPAALRGAIVHADAAELAAMMEDLHKVQCKGHAAGRSGARNVRAAHGVLHRLSANKERPQPSRHLPEWLRPLTAADVQENPFLSAGQGAISCRCRSGARAIPDRR
ncbi:hypothetical protein [Cupriavidus necator]|uniref:hypothetical protein n=1 Tax=Cupriavidus necator TaxID=106590 RepID=UPI0030F3D143